MQKCMICDKEAFIERRFSGEKYCVRHAKEKLVFGNLREILKKSKGLMPNKNYIVSGRYPPEYGFIINILEKYFSNFNIDVEISKQFHLSDLSSESHKIMREYSKIWKQIEEKDTVVILIKTADLIAHDMIFLILEGKFEYLEKLRSWDRKLIFPFKNVFLSEICRLFDFYVEPYKHCSIYEFIKRMVETRPTTVYGILNYVKNLSNLYEARY